MPTVNLSSLAGSGTQFFDDSGVPLAGGLIYTYAAGGTTPLVTYTSSSGVVAHPNPIVLDSAGRINEIWIPEGTSYKFILKSSTNVIIGSFDNLFPIASLPVSIHNGGTGASTADGARVNLGLSTFAVPTGALIMWPSNTIPSDWLLCNGAAVSRVTYSTLFSLLGTTFGAGDGSITFNLPDYRSRFPYGASAVVVGASGGSTTITTNNLPSHTHTFSVTSTGSGTTNSGNAAISDPGHGHSYGLTEGASGLIGQAIGGTGPFFAGFNGSARITSIGSGTNTATTGITDSGHTHGFSVSTSGSGTTASTGSGTAFLQPYLGINFIIKS
jgi:microcystin-dependent protein